MDCQSFMGEHHEFISKQFLESVIGNAIISFSVEPGSKVGDNFMSDLWSIKAKVDVSNENGECREDFYMLKCYPKQTSRQNFLKRANHFHNELCFYDGLAKDLVNFQDITEQVIIPSIAPFLGGKAVDYSLMKNLDGNLDCSPLDNFILMRDLKRSDGFKMFDVKRGLNFEHVKLAFIELAKIHALSWAYRNKIEWDLPRKYPFLKKTFDSKKGTMWLGILDENLKSVVNAIDSSLGKGNDLTKSLNTFQGKARTIIEFFSTQDESTEEEVKKLLKRQVKLSAETPSWRVVCHGDCWNNNLLYQYETEEFGCNPLRVAMIDFPLVKLGCPTLDLASLIYTSTRRCMREKYLDTCFQVYYDKFVSICELRNVPALPGFSMDSLRGKFHVSKLAGLLIAIISLPMNLIKTVDESEENVELVDKKLSMEDLLQETCAAGVKNKLYNEWIVELVQEIYDDGVI